MVETWNACTVVCIDPQELPSKAWVISKRARTQSELKCHMPAWSTRRGQVCWGWERVRLRRENDSQKMNAEMNCKAVGHEKPPASDPSGVKEREGHFHEQGVHLQSLLNQLGSSCRKIATRTSRELGRAYLATFRNSASTQMARESSATDPDWWVAASGVGT